MQKSQCGRCGGSKGVPLRSDLVSSHCFLNGFASAMDLIRIRIFRRRKSGKQGSPFIYEHSRLYVCARECAIYLTIRISNKTLMDR